MKPFETPWSVGSMLICNKCGKTFDKPENADKLKSDLRVFLKESDNHKKIRVMVSGCLNVCISDEQAIVYQPVEGKTQTFTVEKNYEKSLKEIKTILVEKLKLLP